MNTHADKTQENISQSVLNAESQMQSGGESTFQFVDNRLEAIAQRKLQEMANNSLQVSQLRAFQGMANNNPQAKQTAQLRAMADNHSAQQQQPIQKKENNTGLPDKLKTGMENLSGMSLGDVKVHRNSDKPAQLQAHAYAQGTDIHLGQGQEKHLPHEAWHVVQQKQGRVKATMQMKGTVNINDDAGLEKEADVMAAKAFNTGNTTSEAHSLKQAITSKTLLQNQTATVQRLVSREDFEKLAGNAADIREPLEEDQLYLDIVSKISLLEKTKEIRGPEIEIKAILEQLVTLCDAWGKLVSSKSEQISDEDKEGRGDAAKKKKKKNDANWNRNKRKKEFIRGLQKEAQADIDGVILGQGHSTPSKYAAKRNEATGEAKDFLKEAQDQIAGNIFYKFRVVTWVQNPNYGEFAQQRLNLMVKKKAKDKFIPNRFKSFKGEANEKNRIKDLAAKKAIDERMPGASKETKLKEIEALKNAGMDVGHTYVVFTRLDESKAIIDEKSFGFFPLIMGQNTPFQKVAGAVKSPDPHAEEGKNTKEIDNEIDGKQYMKGLSFTVEKMKSPPDYKLVGYNCTYFAKEVAQVVPVSFPLDAYMTAPFSPKMWNPNVLFDKIPKRT